MWTDLRRIGSGRTPVCDRCENVALFLCRDCQPPIRKFCCANHNTHSRIAVDKSSTAKIVERTVFDENRLLASPMGIVSPRVITVLAASFPRVVPDIDATCPGFHGKLAMINDPPGAAKEDQGSLIQLVELNVINPHIWRLADCGYGDSCQASFINCISSRTVGAAVDCKATKSRQDRFRLGFDLKQWVLVFAFRSLVDKNRLIDAR